MSDMQSAIVPKSDQLNADDLIAGEMTVRITGVDIKGGQEQPVSIHFEGDNYKPYKPCKSMSRVLVSAWGPDSKKYVGRSMTLYRDPKVKWAGMEVGGIRISHMSHIADDMTMALTVTRANKKPFTVRPLATGAPSKAAPPESQASPAPAGTLPAPGGAAPDVTQQSPRCKAVIAMINAAKGKGDMTTAQSEIEKLENDAEREFCVEHWNWRVKELKAAAASAPKQTRKEAEQAVADMANDLPFRPTQTTL